MNLTLNYIRFQRFESTNFEELRRNITILFSYRYNE